MKYIIRGENALGESCYATGPWTWTWGNDTDREQLMDAYWFDTRDEAHNFAQANHYRGYTVDEIDPNLLSGK